MVRSEVVCPPPLSPLTGLLDPDLKETRHLLCSSHYKAIKSSFLSCLKWSYSDKNAVLQKNSLFIKQKFFVNRKHNPLEKKSIQPQKMARWPKMIKIKESHILKRKNHPIRLLYSKQLSPQHNKSRPNPQSHLPAAQTKSRPTTNHRP